MDIYVIDSFGQMQWFSFSFNNKNHHGLLHRGRPRACHRL
ncbi:hypothetical protein [Bacteroides nordii]